MRTRILLSLLVPAVLAASPLVHAAESAPAAAKPVAPAAKDYVSATELKAVLGTEKAPLVLDVRSPGEFAAGHVPSAWNVPVGEVASRVAEIRKKAGDRQIVVYCQSGVRAARARTALTGAGVASVHLDGDWAAWDAAGLPSEKGASK